MASTTLTWTESKKRKYVGVTMAVCLIASLAILSLASTHAAAAERSAISQAMRTLPTCLAIVLGFAALVHRALRRADRKDLEFYKRLEVTNSEGSCERIEKELGL
jgi:hypothetical protein